MEILACMGVVKNQRLSIIDARIHVENCAVGRYGDRPVRLKIVVILRRIVALLPDQNTGLNSITLSLLVNLSGELSRWAEISDSLATRSTPPLRDQKPDKCFSSAGRKLNCDIGSVQMLLMVGPKQVGLLCPKMLDVPTTFTESVKETFRICRTKCFREIGLEDRFACHYH